MGQPPEGLDLVAEPFMDNPLVVIAPPDHRLAGRSRIPLACLADETFLIREKGSGTRGAMERFFSEHETAEHSGRRIWDQPPPNARMRDDLALGSE